MSAVADIFIAGAGPTGLTLALQAHDHGARVRIVDRRVDAFRPSRAFIVHPRTLEVLRPIGVTGDILSHGDADPEIVLHLGGRVVRARLGALDLPDTAFPHLTLVRQMDVETALLRGLERRGLAVERGTAVVRIEDGPDTVGVTLRSAKGVETVECRYLAGCDGPDSIVRQQIGLPWKGGPYGEEIILADVELDADLGGGRAHAAIGERGLTILFALGERAAWRLLATRRGSSGASSFGQPGPPVPRDELQALLSEAGFHTGISRVAWSARYRVQHRLAPSFRRGRVFIAGDAAHAYSPATGQGMNTGIQDAANLGWKLAFAPTSSDPVALLGSYDLERRPAARQVLAMTDLAFWGESSSDAVASLLRATAPMGAPLIPFVLRRRRLIAEGIRWMSQLRARYPDSPISEGDPVSWPGGSGAGSRLPDADVETPSGPARLHALTAAPGIHVLLHRDAPAFEQLNLGRLVSFHRLTNVPGPGLVAVRPDGYVGLLAKTSDRGQLQAWLSRLGARATTCR